MFWLKVFISSFSGTWTLEWWEISLDVKLLLHRESCYFQSVCYSKEILIVFWGGGNKQKLKQHRKTTNPPSPLPHKPQPPCLSRCLIWTIFPLISKKLYGQTGTLHLVLPNSITFTCVFSWNYLGKAYMLYIWVQWNAFPKTPEIGWIVS